LTDKDQTALRRLIGQRLKAKALFLLWDALPLAEQGRFSALLDQGSCPIVMDKLILDAIRAARQLPQADAVELAAVVKKQAAAFSADINELVKAEVKKTRDPQLSSATRNVRVAAPAICSGFSGTRQGRCPDFGSLLTSTDASVPQKASHSFSLAGVPRTISQSIPTVRASG
jgi:hypothetical protein